MLCRLELNMEIRVVIVDGCWLLLFNIINIELNTEVVFVVSCCGGGLFLDMMYIPLFMVLYSRIQDSLGGQQCQLKILCFNTYSTRDSDGFCSTMSVRLPVHLQHSKTLLCLRI